MVASAEQVMKTERPATNNWRRLASCGLLTVGCWLVCCVVAAAARFDEFPLERWAKLGEADRYQLNVAEKLFRENNFKAAVSEYEKFLSLYEKSEGAPYAQLKWSMCQSNLRKQNSAIKDGFQSVIDYWPDSPEAQASAFLIGKTYKEMAELKQAKKAYSRLLAVHPDSVAALLAKIDLVDIARIENDEKRRVAMWNEVLKTPKTPDTLPYLQESSRQFADYLFRKGDFGGGLNALTAGNNEPEVPYLVYYFVRGPLAALRQTEEGKLVANKLADLVSTYLKKRIAAELQTDEQKAIHRQTWQWIGEVEAYAGRLELMTQAFEAIYVKLGTDDDSLLKQATFLKGFGKRDEARAIFARMQNQAEGQHQIAYSYREESQPAKAVPIYQQLVASDAKNSSRWLFELGTVYRDSGQNKEAIAAFSQCDNFPEDTKQIAECYRREKNFREALAMYQQVLAGHEPSASWALLEIARTYEAAGDKEAAIKSYQQVCKRYPKSAEASVAHVHLNETYKINITLGGAKDE